MLVERLKTQVKHLSNPQKPKLIFVHVPKTGGTSVDKSLRVIYGRKGSYHIDPILTSRAVNTVSQKEEPNTCPDKFQVRESILLCEMAKGTPYISGHFRFNDRIWQAYAREYAWITVLREPVERYISQYFFDAYKPGDHARVNESLEDFVESDRGWKRGQNYINYFGNFAYRDSADFDTRLETAKENLSKLTLIGFLDHLEKFQDNLKHKLNLTITVPHANKNPVARPEVSPVVKNKIEEICKYDSLLYSYAQEKFR